MAWGESAADALSSPVRTSIWPAVTRGDHLARAAELWEHLIMLVEMNDKEKRLWDEIVHYWTCEFSHPRGHNEKWDTDKIGEKQRALTNSLIKRKAIPAHRFKWMEDPDFFIGSKKSRLQVFSENFGASDDRIFEYPHWYAMGYLPFLVGVISLPDHVVEQFRRDAESRMNNAYDMGMKYRGLAKSLKLPKKAAEEFFKLALDCGYDPYDCRSIRDIIHRHLK